MKARLPMNAKDKKRVKEQVDIYYRQEGKNFVRRAFKMLFVILHQEYGFSTKRLCNIMEKVSDFGGERKNDEVYWCRIDRLLIDELGLPLDRENYEEMGE